MKFQRWYTPYLLLAPALIWVAVFAIWPFLNTVYLAFTDARPLRTPHFIGFDNFTQLFSDERFIYALVTSLLYVVLCVPLLTFLPLLLALLVEKKVPGISLFRTTYYFPVIASVVVVGIIWSWLFDSRGIINESLQFIGITDAPIDFLIDRWLIIISAASLTIWKGLGYYMVVYLAALGNVSKELYEAAALDGAGWWRRFWSVTVPGVRGAMMLVSALITVAAMRVFSEIYVLTNGSGGPGGKSQSMVMLIQQTGKGLNGNLGYASAISVVLFALTIIPLLFVLYINQGEEIRETLRIRKTAKLARRTAKARVASGRVASGHVTTDAAPTTVGTDVAPEERENLQ
ncbi:multiple sugar transport system permease protein [Arcanobacterium pluranimalium]|uniref:carbohydrate ABC transporter permease n=1 Tax=Arcanobacterium pluranimalium TaxID=108028 RepID=UPI00195E06DF|nr:sugar ABC transporter permease [Arcanobacterium pluranimalium]MBM7824325.1 multiple sugar transport system permease protein [Arcanobacterium pluranimalium]